MSTPEQVTDESLAGTARLPVVVLVSLSSFFVTSLLEYSLPLYFNALPGFPKGVWADLAAWQVAPWIIGPFLSGLLARRYGNGGFGERRWRARPWFRSCWLWSLVLGSWLRHRCGMALRAR
jgi:hypothetical protein